MIMKKHFMYVVMVIGIALLSACVFGNKGDEDFMDGYWWTIYNEGVECTSENDTNGQKITIRSAMSPFEAFFGQTYGAIGDSYNFTIDEANKKMTFSGIPNIEFDGSNIVTNGTTTTSFIYNIVDEKNDTDDKFTWYAITDAGQRGDKVYDLRRRIY